MTQLWGLPLYNTASADKITTQIEPLKFTAGETLKWSRGFMDYPASAGWTLRYIAVGTGGKIVINSSSADGDSQVMEVTSATSSGYAPGFYEWQALAISADGLEKHKVLDGIWTIEQSFDALSNGFDARSHARKVLDNIEAVIEGRATKDQAEYSISGRMLRLTPLPDLVRFRQFYKQEVERENKAAQIKAGLGSKNKIQVRFSR
jgi:hypothetical protein